MMKSFLNINRVILQSGKVAKFSTTKSSSEIFSGAYLNRDLVTNRVIDVVKSMTKNERVHADTYFSSDLGLDSMLRKELNEALAAEFCVNVPKEKVDNLVSVKSAVDFFATHPKAR
jgi:NADH dehydrogenase (ubiquinone) 1 alpha/beta subcomplex 1